MSDGTPDPFALFRQLLGSGDPWQRAADVAAAMATEGRSEANVDPAERLRIEELARVAQLHVQNRPDLHLSADTRVETTTRGDWARRSLATYRPFLERFIENVEADNADLSAELELGDGDGTDPLGGALSGLFAQLMGNLGPMMITSTAGSMVGHLGTRTLGQYDLPVPRQGDVVLVVPAAIDEAADTWGLPRDEVRLWVLVAELVAHALLSTPHVARQLETLLLDYASGFHADPERLAGSLDLGEIGIDPTTGFPDLAKLQELSGQFGDPSRLIDAMRTPPQDLIRPQLSALVAALLGTVDLVTSQIMAQLSTDPSALRERFRDRWREHAPADRFVEGLLGITIDPEVLERGERFVGGIVERAGTDAVARLWADELDLPTPAEVDAPGLWLARIGLGDEPAFEIPDDLSGLDLGDDGPDPT